MPPKFKRNVPREDVIKADDVEKETLLEHDSDPDEEMLFNNPSTSSGPPRGDGRKMDSVRIQLREVTDATRDNVQKVMERGDKLEDLRFASDRLAAASDEFHDSAKRARRKAWAQNIKARIVVGVITLTVVIGIIGTLIKWYS